MTATHTIPTLARRDRLQAAVDTLVAALGTCRQAEDTLSSLGDATLTAAVRNAYTGLRSAWTAVQTARDIAARSVRMETEAAERHQQSTPTDVSAPSTPLTPVEPQAPTAGIPDNAALADLSVAELTALCSQHGICPPKTAGRSQLRTLLGHKRDGKLHPAFHAKPTAAAQTVKAEQPKSTSAPEPKPAPAPEAETPKLTPAPVQPSAAQVTKPAAEPKGESEYRQLQARCKTLGVSAKGSADELRSRIAAAEAKPQNPEPAGVIQTVHVPANYHSLPIDQLRSLASRLIDTARPQDVVAVVELLAEVQKAAA